MKEILYLSRASVANPNATPMQPYAANCVCMPMWIAQAELAEAAVLAPELISPPKCLPEDSERVPCLRLQPWCREAWRANLGLPLRSQT